MNENAIFRTPGTGANIDIYCGFAPAEVRVINTDSAAADAMSWFVGFPDGHAILTAANTRSKITTLGVSMLNSPTLGLGFRIGAQAAVNVAGQNITVIASRGGEGNQAP